MADSYDVAQAKISTPEQEAQKKEDLDNAIKASLVSLEDYDPKFLPDAEKVVELVDHSSHFIKDLVDHENSVIAKDAQDVVAELHPSGENFPNGPASTNESVSDGEVVPVPVEDEQPTL